MEIIPVIFFLIFVAIVFGNVVSFVRGHGTWSKSFEQLATRYGGWFSSARTTRPPAATFKYKSQDVRVKCKRTKKRIKETEFRIRWPGFSFKLEILLTGRFPKRRSLKGRAPVPTGDDNFDAAYNVFCDGRTAGTIGKLVSSGVRWQVQQLANFMPSVPVMVSIEKGWLVVRKQAFIKEAQPLDDYVRFCLELYDQLTLTTSEGIEFREDVVISAVDEVRCPICSCDIDGKMVLCVRCKTPHCLDCWQYNLKCGMYACSETRYSIVGSE